MKLPRTVTTVAPLAAIVLLAAALRAYHIGYESVWTDEIASLQQSAGHATATFEPPLDAIHRPGIDLTSVSDARPWPDVWRNLRSDTHPPLYLLLLRLCRTLFGEGDRAARALSAAFSVVAALLLYDTCRLLHSRRTALWAAAVMSVATWQIVYAHEARAYAMLVAMVLGCCDALVRIEKLGSSKPRLITFALCILAAMMTHYAAIPAVAAIGLYCVLKLRGAARRDALLSLGVAALGFLIVWGPMGWQQRANFTSNLGWISDDATPGHFARTMRRLATLPLQFFITPRNIDSAGPLGWLGAIFYLFPLLLLNRHRRDLLLWVLVGGAVIGAATISDLAQNRKSLEVLRYTLVAAPAAYVLIAALGNGMSSKWLSHGIPAVVFLSCLAALPEAYNRWWKPDYSAFAAEFDRDAGPDDIIVASYASRDDWYESLLVSVITHYSAHPHRPLLVLSAPASADLRRELRSAPAVWFVTGSQDPEPRLHELLPGAKLARTHSMPQVGVYVKLELADER